MSELDEDGVTEAEADLPATADAMTQRRSRRSNPSSDEPDFLAQVAAAVNDFFQDSPRPSDGPEG